MTGDQDPQPTPDPFGAPPAAMPVYPTTFEDQPHKKKRKKWKWIVGGIVLLLVVLGAVGLIFGRKGSDTPHDAANKFWTALVAHDAKKAQNYVCSKKNFTSNESSKTFIKELTSFSIGAESGSGDKRTYPVTVDVSVDGQTHEGTITTTVVKNTGEWYVCDLSDVVATK